MLNSSKSIVPAKFLANLTAGHAEDRTHRNTINGMKNTASKLKKKHRNWIWADEEGDFWYWDSVTESWATLICDQDGGFRLSDDHNPNHFSWFCRIAPSVFTGGR